MKMSFRGWLIIGLCTAAAVLIVMSGSPSSKAADSPAAAPSQQGPLTQESLGHLLGAMGLKPKLQKKRYDFSFKAIHGKEEWELSMSAVLSQNGKSIWVMAWLDELPRSAADVPRTSLLRLLAANDNLGKGTFFAYIANNRRFVLERIVPNENISTAGFRKVLQNLGASVVETYPHWSVANWKRKLTGGSSVAGSTRTNTAPRTVSRRAVSPTALKESKFQSRSRN